MVNDKKMKKRLPHKNAAAMIDLSVIRALDFVSFSEEKRYTPYSGERNERIYYPFDRVISSAKPFDGVEPEKPDASPVQRTDNG